MDPIIYRVKLVDLIVIYTIIESQVIETRFLTPLIALFSSVARVTTLLLVNLMILNTDNGNVFFFFFWSSKKFRWPCFWWKFFSLLASDLELKRKKLIWKIKQPSKILILYKSFTYTIKIIIIWYSYNYSRPDTRQNIHS